MIKDKCCFCKKKKEVIEKAGQYVCIDCLYNLFNILDDVGYRFVSTLRAYDNMEKWKEGRY